MNRIVIIILVIIFFIMGLNMSDYSYSINNILEEEKEEFEENIIKPSNQYVPKDFVPKENIVNKVAHKIDSVIDKVVDIFFEKIKSL